jgi:hypothetical protein
MAGQSGFLAELVATLPKFCQLSLPFLVDETIPEIENGRSLSEWFPWKARCG